MIDFAVFALPRSGTTWATAWLSHYATVLHDPLMDRTPIKIGAWGDETEGPTGIVCTAGWVFPGWVDALARESRVAFLLRSQIDINASLKNLRIRAMSNADCRRFEETAIGAGPVYFWDEMFEADGAKLILKYLLPEATFNPTHHDELRKMHIEPHPDVIERLRRMAG